MRIQRLQTRIIVFFVALLALVQIAAFWFVNAANSRNAQTKVAEELNVGQRVFARLLDQNAEKLKLSARVLAADFAFREAIATHDTGTIASALANHGGTHRRRRHGVRRSEGRGVATPSAAATAHALSSSIPRCSGNKDAAWRQHGSARRPRVPARGRAGARAAAHRLGGHGLRRSTSTARAICASSPSSRCRSRSSAPPARTHACLDA
jgi:hypothetical protein